MTIASALLLAAPLALAVVIFSDTNVVLTGSGITLTLAAGGSLPSYSAGSTTLTLSLVSGSSVTVKSPGLDTLTNSQSAATQCSGTAYSYVSFSASTSTTVTLTPTTTIACTGGGGGSGGGGSPYFPISVSKTGTGSGTVTGVNIYGSLNCGTTCTATLLGGSAVTLTATPASGSGFASWGGDCSSATSTICTLSMYGPHTVTASFSLTSSTPSSSASGAIPGAGGTGTASSSPSSMPETVPPVASWLQMPAQAAVTSPTLPPPARALFTQPLKLGSHGPQVILLQNTLKSLGLFPSSVKSNGVFGPTTLKAVKAFQVQYHIAKAGVVGFGQVGPKTRQTLNQLGQ